MFHALTSPHSAMTIQANTFIFGCPRSGTTLLAEILNCNDQAAMLIERHAVLNRDKSLRLADYEIPKSSDFAKYPCEHEHLNKKILESMLSMDSNRVYGDKIPKLYENHLFFQNIQRQGLKVTIIATIRNVFDVCLSYNARMKVRTDNWLATSEDGVRDWNTFLLRLLAISHDSSVLLFDYDNSSLFFEDFDQFQILSAKVYSSVGLDAQLTESGKTKLREVFKVAKNSLPTANPERLKRRLSPYEMKRITEKANFNLYNEICSKDEPIIRVSA